MMRSLYAGVSGLRVHQTQMDVIGNNIANVNTVGFKKSRVTFQEMLNQTLRGASSPQDNRGGTNPTQIGLGVNLGSIDVIHTAGSPQSTGKSLDMSIEGEGYFVVGEGSNYYYTRAGNFDFDINNKLVNSNGLVVKGWVRNTGDADLLTTGEVTDIDLSAWKDNSIAGATTELKIGKNLDSRLENNPTTTLTNISFTNTDITGASSSEPYVLELGSVFADSIELEDADGNTVTINHNDNTFTAGDDYRFDRVTGKLEIYGNAGGTFDALTAVDDTISINTFDTTSHSTSITVYDQNGVPHDLVIQYRKVASSPDFQWQADAFIKGENSTGIEGYEKVTASSHTIEFDADGKITTGKNLTVQRSFTGGTSVDIDIDFTQLTQLGQDTTALALNQNGYEPGSLQSLSVNTSGAIVGTFSNGQNITLAQVAVGTFANPGGLAKYGNTLFRDSKNSGEALIGTAGTAGRGVIKPETLEMSNVDLSSEFVDMITTQRGFQANSRIITTSDEMLQELVNLKR